MKTSRRLLACRGAVRLITVLPADGHTMLPSIIIESRTALSPRKNERCGDA